MSAITDKIYIYGGDNYQGWSVDLSPGKYTYQDLVKLITKIPNYKDTGGISSIKNDNNGTIKVTIFTGDAFTGYKMSFISNVPKLSTIPLSTTDPVIMITHKTFNNVVRSIIVEKVVTIYQDCISSTNITGGGKKVSLPVGEYPDLQKYNGFPDNKLSAIRIPPRFKVELYEHPNFGGVKKVFTSSDFCLVNNNFNDKASSMKVISTAIAPVSSSAPAPAPARIPSAPSPSPAPAQTQSAPAPVPAPSPASVRTQPAPVPVPAPVSNFTQQSYILSSTPTERKQQNTCSVYYTTLTDACDKGIFELHEDEITKQYANNPKTLKLILDEKKKLPEPNVCKVNLYNWRNTSNGPLINSVETGLINRGDPSNWAYCFKPLKNTDELQSMVNNTSSATSFNIYSSPINSLFGDGISYARLAFKKLDYASVKNDACAYINNAYSDSTIPNGMFGLQVDNIMKIKNIGIYNIENGKIKQSNKNELEIYKKLFTEEMVSSKLMLKPYSASATVYVLGTDTCGIAINNMTASAILNVGDFGIQDKIIYEISNPTDDKYGTTQTLQTRLNTLYDLKQQEVAKQTTITDPKLLEISKNLVASYDKRIQTITNTLAVINERINNSIKEQIPKMLNKKINPQRIPPALLSGSVMLFFYIP